MPVRNRIACYGDDDDDPGGEIIEIITQYLLVSPQAFVVGALPGR